MTRKSERMIVRRKGERGFAAVLVLVVAAALLAILTGAFAVVSRLHSQNLKEKAALGERCGKINSMLGQENNTERR